MKTYNTLDFVIMLESVLMGLEDLHNIPILSYTTIISWQHEQNCPQQMLGLKKSVQN